MWRFEGDISRRIRTRNRNSFLQTFSDVFAFFDVHICAMLRTPILDLMQLNFVFFIGNGIIFIEFIDILVVHVIRGLFDCSHRQICPKCFTLKKWSIYLRIQELRSKLTGHFCRELREKLVFGKSLATIKKRLFRLLPNLFWSFWVEIGWESFRSWYHRLQDHCCPELEQVVQRTSLHLKTPYSKSLQRKKAKIIFTSTKRTWLKVVWGGGGPIWENI